MRYISEENLRQHIIIEGCDEGCGYIDERDLEGMEWEEIPERPKGKWLSELRLYGEGKDKYECSICHRTITVNPLSESLCDYPFCHCGADMREVNQ